MKAEAVLSYTVRSGGHLELSKGHAKEAWNSQWPNT